MKSRRIHGFTIVELLIVIVVIGVLAAITIVAYNGIQNRADRALLQSGLSNTSKQLEAHRAELGRYPVSIDSCPVPVSGSICVKSTSNDFNYVVTSDGSGYQLVASSARQSMSLANGGGATENNSNLLTGGSLEKTGGNEFLRYADLAPIIAQWGLVQYTVSFDIKSANIANRSLMQVYAQNGSGTRYSFGTHYVPVTTTYQRQSVTFTPTVADSSLTESWLAFYGTYSTGNVPSVKNVKVEVGSKATPL